MLSRRRFLAASGALVLVGCAEGPTIERFDASGETARPGGRGLAQPITVSYRLRRPAEVSALLRGAGGEWALRDAAPRTAGEEYQLVFDGTVPTGEADRSVVRDGRYELRLTAVEPDGRRDERAAPVEVTGADVAPLELEGPRLSQSTITPDGDGADDEVRIDFKLLKAAEVTITAESEQGERATILAPARREAGEAAVLWDGSGGGRVFGGKRLPDGEYTIALTARDEAGNVRVRQAPLRLANGGIERLEIAEVTMEPPQLRAGEQLRVRIRVVNTGETVLRTLGPPPGTPYRTSESFSTILNPATGQPYQLASGAWRVGLGWQIASQELPLRWGLLPDVSGTIAPGASATVEAAVRVELPPGPMRFWVGAIREGVGLATGRVGDHVVTILP